MGFRRLVQKEDPCEDRDHFTQGWHLCPLDTHRDLKKILNDPKRRTNRIYDKRYYLLSGGILRCFRCGHPLVCSATGTRKRSYVCSAPVPMPGPDGCRNGKLRIIAEPLEEYVVKISDGAVPGVAGVGSGSC